MIPALLKPYWPLILTKLKEKLAAQRSSQIAGELVAQARADLTPTEQGALAQALRLAAEQLGV